MKLSSLMSEVRLTSSLQISNWRELELRSPKLSKYLLSRRMPSRLVSQLISWLQPGRLELTNSQEDIVAQGATVHFKSCQAPGHELNAVEGDVYAALRGWLYMAVIRTSKGFQCRAKIRRCENRAGRTVGWYVEPVYGHGASPLAAYQVALLLKKAGEKGYENLAFAMPDEHQWLVWLPKPEELEMTVNIPSARFGYQDTLDEVAGPHDLTFYRIEAKEVDPNEVLAVDLKFRYDPYRTRGVLESALYPEQDDPEDWGDDPRLVAAETVMRRTLRYFRWMMTADRFVRWVTGTTPPKDVHWGVRMEGRKVNYGQAHVLSKEDDPFFSLLVANDRGWLLDVRFALDEQILKWDIYDARRPYPKRGEYLEPAEEDDNAF